MSDYEQRHKPPTTADPGQRQERNRSRFLPGGSVEADCRWAQNRIANFFRAAATAAPLARKATGADDPATNAGPEVSQPGDPAEKEADAVADDVAEELHGDGEKAGEHAHAGKEQAPAIGAKLQPGTIARAGKDPLRSNTRDALGGGPTTAGMRVGNAQQAGVTRTPRHHILPREHRAWFAERGVDVDAYCVELSQGDHTAIHTLGYNPRVMDEMNKAEARQKRKLKKAEIIAIAKDVMAEFKLKGPFVPYRDK